MRTRRQQRGAVLFVATAAVVAVAGAAAAVVDISTGLLMRTRMQAAADAGALAASHHLVEPANESAARAAAVKWVRENGFSINESHVSFFTRENGKRAVNVKWKQTVDTTFARIVGIERFDVAIDASATPGDILEIPLGLIPLGLAAQQVEDADGNVHWEVLSGLRPNEFVKAQNGTEIVLKVGAHDNIKGNFLGLGLDGAGGKVYRDTIANGSYREVRAGQYVDTETGNMQGPTQQGFQDREKRFMGSANADDWREVYIPLINRQDWESANGKSKVRVVGFGVARITDINKNGEVHAVFVSKALGGRGSLAGGGVAPNAFAPVLIETPPSLRS